MLKVPAEYNVVRSDTALKLAKNVQLAFRDGFEPQGGVMAIHDGSGIIFMQAVVKYEFISEMEYTRRRAGL